MMGIMYFVLSAILLFLVIGYLRTYAVQHGQNQKDFLKGALPRPLPEGLYHGTVRGMNTSWLGKSFDQKNQRGINLFSSNNTESRKYPFRTYVGKGIQDTTLDVLKIDYNVSDNPFWFRPILDEIVETKPNHYLGKLHIRLFFLPPFTLGYFMLGK